MRPGFRQGLDKAFASAILLVVYSACSWKQVTVGKGARGAGLMVVGKRTKGTEGGRPVATCHMSLRGEAHD